MKRRRRAQTGAQPAAEPLCRALRPLIFAYMARELGAAQSELMREHLRHCAGCVAEAAGISRALSALQSADPAPGSAAAAFTPRRRARTLWLMERPLIAWFFLHRRVAGLVCALAAAALAVGALMLIKSKDFIRAWEPRVEVRLIITQEPAGAPAVEPLDEPPLK